MKVSRLNTATVAVDFIKGSHYDRGMYEIRKNISNNYGQEKSDEICNELYDVGADCSHSSFVNIELEDGSCMTFFTTDMIPTHSSFLDSELRILNSKLITTDYTIFDEKSNPIKRKQKYNHYAFETNIKDEDRWKSVLNDTAYVIKDSGYNYYFNSGVAYIEGRDKNGKSTLALYREEAGKYTLDIIRGEKCDFDGLDIEHMKSMVLQREEEMETSELQDKLIHRCGFRVRPDRIPKHGEVSTKAINAIFGAIKEVNSDVPEETRELYNLIQDSAIEKTFERGSKTGSKTYRDSGMWHDIFLDFKDPSKSTDMNYVALDPKECFKRGLITDLNNIFDQFGLNKIVGMRYSDIAKEFRYMRKIKQISEQLVVDRAGVRKNK